MLIKASDDRTADVAALEALLARRGLPPETKDRIESELRTVAAGAKTERDTTYQIEFHCGSKDNIMTLHDLRLEHEGRVAQIDHLILNRLLEIYVCESKSFAGGVSINDYGEWSTYHRGVPRGVPSPIEQNLRHVAVLADVLNSNRVTLPTRLGLRLMPELRPLVVVSSSARISRPRRRVAGVELVVKADQILTTIDRAVDDKLSRAFEHGNVGAILAVGKAVSSSTLEALARGIAALHQPIAFDWAAKFGLEAQEVPVKVAADGPVCGSCSRPVSQKVADFCRDNPSRFNGRVLCWDCQRQTARSKSRLS